MHQKNCILSAVLCKVIQSDTWLKVHVSLMNWEIHNLRLKIIAEYVKTLRTV